MTQIHRRQFLTRSRNAGLGVAAGWTILQNAGSARGAPAADKIVLGVIGAGGRGSNLARDFAARDDVLFAGVSDPDSNRRAALCKALADQQGGSAPQSAEDYRSVLDDKAVDAVIVATPDHWHALPTIHSCQAGKDVYVEKPPSHNCWEGRKMVEAARKYERVVQVGTQNRSAEYNQAARQYLADGKQGQCNGRRRPQGELPLVQTDPKDHRHNHQARRGNNRIGIEVDEQVGQGVAEGAHGDGHQKEDDQQRQQPGPHPHHVLAHVADRAALITHTQIQGAQVMHRSDEDGTDQHPQDGGQPAPGDGNRRAQDGPQTGDGREMVPEQDRLSRRYVIHAIG
jgi:hypothetical protein